MLHIVESRVLEYWGCVHRTWEEEKQTDDKYTKIGVITEIIYICNLVDNKNSAAELALTAWNAQISLKKKFLNHRKFRKISTHVYWMNIDTLFQPSRGNKS